MAEPRDNVQPPWFTNVTFWVTGDASLASETATSILFGRLLQRVAGHVHFHRVDATAVAAIAAAAAAPVASDFALLESLTCPAARFRPHCRRCRPAVRLISSDRIRNLSPVLGSTRKRLNARRRLGQLVGGFDTTLQIRSKMDVAAAWAARSRSEPASTRERRAVYCKPARNVDVADLDLSRIAEDIARVGVSTAVLLSSNLVVRHPVSVMAASHEREEAVLGAALGESLVTLRPEVFMDNDATEWSGSIRNDGAVTTTFPDILQVPIAPADIAAEAVAAMTRTGHPPPEPQRLFGSRWFGVRERVEVLVGVLNTPITIREVSADEHRALLARRLPEPIAAQKVAMLGAAPRSLDDCPDLPLGQRRTPYSVWAAMNTAAFGPTGA